jgi:hypothetical protein
MSFPSAFRSPSKMEVQTIWNGWEIRLESN